MKLLSQKLIKTEELEVFVCDCCGKKIFKDDFVDFEEIWSVRKVGGYGSVFGDGDILEIDLCQDCAKKLLGPYIKITGNIIGDD